jgi:two-component system, NarL family, response regulator LiaR
MPYFSDGIPKRYTMTASWLIQVLIVDDHTMVRKGLKILLEQFPGIKVVGEAANGLQAIEYVSRLVPDVVLMDLVMPVMDGIEAIQRIIAIHPDQRIIVLTASSDGETFVQAIKAGAQGYFVKDLDPEELVRAIQSVYQGRPEFDSRFVREVIRRARIEDPSSQLPGRLSEKELVILRLLSHGMTDQEIAHQLFVSEITVRTHISRIVRKLGFQNRVQAVLYSLRSGLVPESEVARVTFGQYEPK